MTRTITTRFQQGHTQDCKNDHILHSTDSTSTTLLSCIVHQLPVRNQTSNTNDYFYCHSCGRRRQQQQQQQQHFRRPRCRVSSKLFRLLLYYSMLMAANTKLSMIALVVVGVHAFHHTKPQQEQQQVRRHQQSIDTRNVRIQSVLRMPIQKIPCYDQLFASLPSSSSSSSSLSNEMLLFEKTFPNKELLQHLHKQARNGLLVSDDTIRIGKQSSSPTMSSLKYLRWYLNSTTNSMELQTRITTFQRYPTNVPTAAVRTTGTLQQQPQQTIQLHSQFHFADTKEYYEQCCSSCYSNDNNIPIQYDAIFYELLVDESLIEYVTDMDDCSSTLDDDDNDNDDNTNNVVNNKKRRTLKASTILQASPQDEQIAKQYNWYCQVNHMPYNNNNNNWSNTTGTSMTNWYHADFTRQEFLSYIQQQQEQERNDVSSSSSSIPLWKRALQLDIDRSKPVSPTIVVDATTALLVGPPIIVGQQQQQQQQQQYLAIPGTSLPSTKTISSTNIIRRRIFTNLFLSGNTITLFLRYILWMTIPCPELSILVMDWSTTYLFDNDLISSTSSNSNSRISTIAIPLLYALSNGRFNDIRRLLFGQVAVAGHNRAISMATTTTTPPYESDKVDSLSLLITKRNDHALQQVMNEFNRRRQRQHQGSCVSSTNIALLYGCNHCPDLHIKIMDEGFIPIMSEWRTAWSVSTSTTTTPPHLTGESHIESNPNHTRNDMHRIDSTTVFLNTGIVGFFVVLLLPCYFVIGGYDWIETIVDIVRSVETNQYDSTITIVLFYIARHVLLYLSLSKFILDGNEN